MNVRELIDALGAGDLDAEVYVAVDGPEGPRPLGYIDECFHRHRSRLVLCPLDAEEGSAMPTAFVSDSAPPLIRLGQGDYARDYLVF